MTISDGIVIAIISTISLVATVVSLGYLVFALACIVLWRERGAEHRAHNPGISLFKPVRGANDRLYDNLKSFCDQDYPNFQIIFGVRNDRDPALPVIRRLIDEFPGLDLKLSIGCDENASNPKVATLLVMEGLADHDIWVIADSDVSVRPDFLVAVAAEFVEPDIGAVTCLYTASAEPRLSLRFGAMAINEWFLPSALVAAALGSLEFCFGAAMAVRRDILVEIGGFSALANNLADDFMLGNRVHRAGYRVALAGQLVETEVTEKNLSSMLLREIRWGRTIRAVQPASHLGLALTHGIPLALISCVLTSFSTLALGLVAGALTLRLAIHYAVRHFLGVEDRVIPWLTPLRDCWGFLVWLLSYTRRTVDWRGRRYRVERGGLMKPIGTR